MPPDAPDKPARSAETQARDAERRKRLASALRDNLRRRKPPVGERPAADEPKA